MCSCCRFLLPCSQSTLSLGEGQQANPRSHSPMKTVNPMCWDRVPLARGLGKAEPKSSWLYEVAFGDRKPGKLDS